MFFEEHLTVSHFPFIHKQYILNFIHLIPALELLVFHIIINASFLIHFFQVRYHILGRHLHLRPYKCGYCTFSHHTRWAVEDHLKVSHIGQPHNIHELIRENTERIKKFLRKVKLNGRNPNQLETMGTGGPGSVALPHKGNGILLLSITLPWS